MSADEHFEKFAASISFPLEQPIKIGGNYQPTLQDDHTLHISGQIPRVGDVVTHVGRAGSEVTLAQAQEAGKICVARALLLAKQQLGTLQRITAVPRVAVYVRSAEDFTQQSEVADGVSNALVEILGPVGMHARTSVGVFQLPKGAVIEVEFVFSVR